MRGVAECTFSSLNVANGSFVIVFLLLHIMVYAFGFMNYGMKDNLTNARTLFGITYPIARSAALVLHVDVALILFRTSPRPQN